jgi:hypothetical protein
MRIFEDALILNLIFCITISLVTNQYSIDVCYVKLFFKKIICSHVRIQGIRIYAFSGYAYTHSVGSLLEIIVLIHKARTHSVGSLLEIIPIYICGLYFLSACQSLRFAETTLTCNLRFFAAIPAVRFHLKDLPTVLLCCRMRSVHRNGSCAMQSATSCP